MTQQRIELTVEDMQELIQTDETSRLKVQAIALHRRVAELEAENAELKAQIAEPDTTTTTNNKNDSKLTAVGAD
jgi:DNA-binding transcriptional MerR regulator